MMHDNCDFAEENIKSENLVVSLHEYFELALLSQPVKSPDWEDISNG